MRSLAIRSRALLAGAALSAILPVFAAAQTASAPMTPAQRYDNVRAVQSFADCVVARFPQDARAAIRDDVSNEQLRENYRRLLNQRCASTAGVGRIAIAFPGAGFKYALGEGVVRSLNPAAWPSSFASVPALTWQPVVTRSDSEVAAMRPDWRAQYEARVARERDEYLLANMGECVARNNPNAVRDTALNSTSAEAYRASIQPLVTALQTCLPQGSSVRIRPDQLRGAALYAYARMAIQLPGNGGGQ